MDGADIDQWSDMVEDLLVQCEIRAADPARLVGDLHWLLETGPAQICEPVRPQLSRPALQGLLDCGATESAALRLVGRCTYMLSRGEEGLVIATVLAPHSQRDYSFSAFSEAVAQSGALATCMQEIVTAAVRTDRMNPRLSQS
jgi:hypothetical protein